MDVRVSINEFYEKMRALGGVDGTAKVPLGAVVDRDRLTAVAEAYNDMAEGLTTPTLIASWWARVQSGIPGYETLKSYADNLETTLAGYVPVFSGSPCAAHDYINTLKKYDNAIQAGYDSEDPDAFERAVDAFYDGTDSWADTNLDYQALFAYAKAIYDANAYWSAVREPARAMLKSQYCLPRMGVPLCNTLPEQDMPSLDQALKFGTGMPDQIIAIEDDGTYQSETSTPLAYFHGSPLSQTKEETVTELFNETNSTITLYMVRYNNEKTGDFQHVTEMNGFVKLVLPPHSQAEIHPKDGWRGYSYCANRPYTSLPWVYGWTSPDGRITAALRAGVIVYYYVIAYTIQEG